MGLGLRQKMLNVVVPPFIWFLVVFSFPFLLLLRAFKYVLRRTFCYDNVSGKVVVITGASSGIGEALAYEYASRRARLAIAARREDCLQRVATKARQLGSPDVIVIQADVSKVDDCQKLIQETVNHYGRLDHLVNNAGITKLSWFEDYTPTSEFYNLMDVNFWGAANCTKFALPHLRRCKGQIVLISSVSGRISCPKIGFYGASKAAVISLFEEMRVEVGSEVGITIVTPGLVKSEMSQTEEVRSEPFVKLIPHETAERCAKSIVKSACRGDRSLTVPGWMRMAFLLKFACPEIMDLVNIFILANLNKKKHA
ncbi:11-beta-hydroxysteroid dehydrogenase A [Linum grandiflorum]